MSTSRARVRASLAVIAGLALAGCGGPAPEPTPTATAAATPTLGPAEARLVGAAYWRVVLEPDPDPYCDEATGCLLMLTPRAKYLGDPDWMPTTGYVSLMFRVPDRDKPEGVWGEIEVGLSDHDVIGKQILVAAEDPETPEPELVGARWSAEPGVDE